ncbi:MAG: rhodanese-like domain-containing protein [Hyphomicrobiales bacterium]|nr:rhodanese-like domain-containing protein [Hyphomicrobiales bacterium]MCP5374403.1 rhodanese-like domain-containing protein [Hyphomicrobiales bacterium]
MEFKPDMILSIALIALAFAASRYLPRLMAGVPFVDPAVVKAKLDGADEVVVVDVRTEGEFRGGHIPGAVNMPLGHIPMRLREIKDELADLKDVPVYVHCRTENRSTRAVRMLKRAGLTNLAVMNGGFRRWRKENLPVETPGAEAS